jgi:hypothetical protein
MLRCQCIEKLNRHDNFIVKVNIYEVVSLVFKHPNDFNLFAVERYWFFQLIQRIY